MKAPELQARPVEPVAPNVWTTASRARSLLLDRKPGPSSAEPTPLLQSLSAREQALVLRHGQPPRALSRHDAVQPRVAARGHLSDRDRPHPRVLYGALGREITLAYWYPGNFVGGPEVFGARPPQWSGMAASECERGAPARQGAARAGTEIPTLAIGVIEGLSFKGKCYSALAQMLGTRSITERLAHLLLHLADALWRRGRRHRDRRDFTHADLAHMVGATRQWVTISLKRLQDQGVVTRANRRSWSGGPRCSRRCAGRDSLTCLQSNCAAQLADCRNFRATSYSSATNRPRCSNGVCIIATRSPKIMPGSDSARCMTTRGAMASAIGPDARSLSLAMPAGWPRRGRARRPRHHRHRHPGHDHQHRDDRAS